MAAMDGVLSALQALQGAPAYALVFGALAASGFGLPVNEDLLLMAAAALTLHGVMQPLPLAATAWCGILVADTLVFHWGHRYGARLLRHRLAARALPAARLERMQALVQRWGAPGLAAVRFLPGLRSPLLFAAGAMKLRYRQLWGWDGMAALVEVPLLVWAVRAVGGRWQQIADALQPWLALVVPAGLALVAVAVLTAWWRRRRCG